MENWQLAVVILSAVLVGALIPTIVQYRATMRTWERLMETNEADLRRSVVEIAQLSQRLNTFGSALETNSKHVHSFFGAFEDITEGVKKLTGTMRTASVVGAAVAPALQAAIRGLQSSAQAAAAAQSAQAAARAAEVAQAAAEHAEAREFDELRSNGVS